MSFPALNLISEYFFGPSNPSKDDALRVAALAKAYLRDACKTVSTLHRADKMDILLQDKEYQSLLNDFLAINLSAASSTPPSTVLPERPEREMLMRENASERPSVRRLHPSPPSSHAGTFQRSNSTTSAPPSTSSNSHRHLQPPVTTTSRATSRSNSGQSTPSEPAPSPMTMTEVRMVSSQARTRRQTRDDRPVPRKDLSSAFDRTPAPAYTPFEQPKPVKNATSSNHPVQSRHRQSVPGRFFTVKEESDDDLYDRDDDEEPDEDDEDDDDDDDGDDEDEGTSVTLHNAHTNLSGTNALASPATPKSEGHFYAHLLPREMTKGSTPNLDPAKQFEKWYLPFIQDLAQESTATIRALKDGIVDFVLDCEHGVDMAIVFTIDQETADAIVDYYCDKYPSMVNSTDEDPRARPCVALTLPEQSITFLEISKVHGRALPDLWHALRRECPNIASLALNDRLLKSLDPKKCAPTRAGSRNFRVFVVMRQSEAVGVKAVKKDLGVVARVGSGDYHLWRIRSGACKPSIRVLTKASPPEPEGGLQAIGWYESGM